MKTSANLVLCACMLAVTQSACTITDLISDIDFPGPDTGGPPRNTVAVNTPVPALVPEAAEYKSVAVLPFAGVNQQVSFENRLRNDLKAVDVYGEPAFHVAEVSASGSSMPTAIQAAQKAGANGVFYGTIEQAAVSKESYTEKKKECTDWDIYLIKCKDGMDKDVMVACERRTAHFVATVNLVATETGELAYTQQKKSSKKNVRCTDDSDAPMSEADLLAAARDEVSKQIIADVTPRTETTFVKIKTSSRNFPGSTEESTAAAREFSGAIRWFKSDRLDKGCSIMKTLSERWENNVEILYNRGLCAEERGDYTRALEFYRRADAHLSKPDNDVNAALERLDGVFVALAGMY